MSSPATETQRLFFALWPDSALQQACHGVARAVVQDGKPVPASNLHLTLAFPGSVDAGQRSCLEQAAEAIRLPQFSLTLDSAGFWPRPRVIWLGITKTPETLRELARQLNACLAGCGLEPERRPFAAHLTVARKARRGPEQAVIEALHWAVADFVLAESLTLPEGAQYRVLRRWPLVPDEQDRG